MRIVCPTYWYPRDAADVHATYVHDINRYLVRRGHEVTVVTPGLPGMALRDAFDTLVYGLGYAITDLTIEKLGLHARVILLSNQVDAGTVDFTVCASVEGRFPAVDRFLATIVDDVRKDLPIWAHKRRLARPSLVPGDGPIGVYRRFARQFYPPEESGG